MVLRGVFDRPLRVYLYAGHVAMGVFRVLKHSPLSRIQVEKLLYTKCNEFDTTKV